MTSRFVSFALVGLFTTLTIPAWSQANDNYTIDTSRTSREVKAGDKGMVSIVIIPGKGKKVHEQAPLSVSLKAPAGTTLDKTKLGHADVVNKGAAAPELRTEFTAQQPGERGIDADLTFFICTEKWCERMQQKVSIAVTVR